MCRGCQRRSALAAHLALWILTTSDQATKTTFLRALKYRFRLHGNILTSVFWEINPHARHPRKIIVNVINWLFEISPVSSASKTELANSRSRHHGLRHRRFGGDRRKARFRRVSEPFDLPI